MTKPWFIHDTGFSTRIDDRDMQLFMRICPEKTYGRGDAIFRSGDAATSLHVIVEGKVKLVTGTPEGQERILAICGPDDFIGEAFLQDASVYRADAVALAPTITCPMSRDRFRQVILKRVRSSYDGPLRSLLS